MKVPAQAVEAVAQATGQRATRWRHFVAGYTHAEKWFVELGRRTAFVKASADVLSIRSSGAEPLRVDFPDEAAYAALLAGANASQAAQPVDPLIAFGHQLREGWLYRPRRRARVGMRVARPAAAARDTLRLPGA